MPTKKNIAIIGGGNIGRAIALGLINSGKFSAQNITITRRHIHLLDDLAEKGFKITSDNNQAIHNSQIVILAVQPQQFNDLIESINPILSQEKHVIISVVSGVSSNQIVSYLGKKIPVIRAMPNTAIAVGESITCLASNNASESDFELTRGIFDSLGTTVVIDEELMTSATALCACGIAFFLRAIRAAAQGGIEIGFHPHQAIPMAAQTAKGAADLLLKFGSHPEGEIDKVTTPLGCTISGLNEMEHQGFSSALIKGIITSANKASMLYSDREK
ncbi:MAG: pyrroline-5-carboxylate reductase [Vulcanimicrobiota bacterium]